MIVLKVDSVGRVVIPSEIRQALCIKDKLYCSFQGDDLLIHKKQPNELVDMIEHRLTMKSVTQAETRFLKSLLKVVK